MAGSMRIDPKRIISDTAPAPKAYMSVSITIPGTPPSVNHLYPTLPNGRRVLSKQGREWKKLVAFHHHRIRRPVVLPPFDIEIRVGRPLNKHGKPCAFADISNYIKAVEDALVDCGMICTDRKVRRVSAERDENIVEPGHTLIVVRHVFLSSEEKAEAVYSG